MPTQLKTKVNTANTQKESKQQKLLSSSIKNLRENLTDLSLRPLHKIVSSLYLFLNRFAPQLNLTHIK